MSALTDTEMNAYRHELPRVPCGSIPHYAAAPAYRLICGSVPTEAEPSKKKQTTKENEGMGAVGEKGRPAPIQAMVSCSGELPQPFENWDEIHRCPKRMCRSQKKAINSKYKMNCTNKNKDLVMK
ncbi:hypothetical protein FQR65_LT16825 [Abscondita terminalis]|nr:hypothetical protein FQR65_LT16825 [Abscondita terminalis]